MGSIARMDPKPPYNCWYMSRPSPQPIGQNRVFEIERPEPLPPLNWSRYIIAVFSKMSSYAGI